MSDYRDKYVKCPFYVSQEVKKIHCAGFTDDSYIQEAHVERRCNSLFGYLKCPLYPTLAKRFEEDKK